ncbi:uncharacterized protein [Miscanthus floridulus]|uniref:uncharacterized protein n=1 Tax=Miscanthus floridulus TaxID=154761 RepID=UPI003458EBDD
MPQPLIVSMVVQIICFSSRTTTNCHVIPDHALSQASPTSFVGRNCMALPVGSVNDLLLLYSMMLVATFIMFVHTTGGGSFVIQAADANAVTLLGPHHHASDIFAVVEPCMQPCRKAAGQNFADPKVP